MRRSVALALAVAVVTVSFGALSGLLLAESRSAGPRNTLASLALRAEWATSHLVPAATWRSLHAIDQSGDVQQVDTVNPKTPAKPGLATVETDKPDYHPYEQVFVTGSGWLPREVVELTFTEIATSPPGGWTDGPFVHYATSDSHGNIENSEFWTDEHDAGVTFLLTAKGVISGRTAQTTFTDALGNLDQCGNGNPLDSTPCQSGNEWINGNLGASKSVYFEGDSIPYRLTMSGLALTTHTATVEWDTTKSGKHALDYITTFNRTASVATASPCAGISGCNSATYTAFPIPADPQITGAGVTPIAGEFRMYGGTITGVSGYSYPNGAGFAGDKSARLTITFTASIANPVLAWGGHIATRTNWGAGGSAVAISGSPYHTRLVDIDGSGGNQDRSLSADAVIFPGSIKIVKDATPNGTTSFPFAASPSPLANFSLVDDGTTANTKLFSNIINFQTYTVNETPVPSGWGFTGISCSVTSANGGSSTTNNTSVSVNLKEGEDWTCTYTNAIQAAQLIVIKHVVNDNGGTKAAGDFTLNAFGGGATPSQFAGQESPGTAVTINAVVTGTNYSVTEGALSGYTTSYSTDCSGTMLPGQTRTCTVTNDDQAATLTVIKHVVNDNGGTKTAANFTMNVTGANVKPSASFAGAESPGTTVTLSAGSYSVDEGTVAGYTKSIGTNCSGTIANGESKTCTITNDDQAATLTVIKHVVNDNGGTKTAANFTMNVTGANVQPSASFAGAESPGTTVTLSAGSYSVDEGTVAGYTKSIGTNCSGTIANGESKTCTITNDDQASTLTVIKHVINDNGGTKTAANFTMNVTGANVQPSASFAGAESPGTTVTLSAGSYSVDEGTVAGYAKSIGTNCSGTIANGESKTCTITNDDQAATLTVIKHVINDNGGTKTAANFTLSVTGNSPSPASFAGAESPGTTVTLSAGSYSVDEGTVAGYAKSLGANCSGTIANGESKSCTITNDDEAATLIVLKQVINNNGGTKKATDFSFSVNGAPPVPFIQNGGNPLAGSNSLTVNAGIYSVVESGTPIAGYATTYDNCSSLSIPNGGLATCTITNDDTQAAPQLTTAQSWLLKDSATLSEFRSGPNDGTITFRLYGPLQSGLNAGQPDVNCNQQLTQDIDETKTGISDVGPHHVPVPFLTTVPGTYRWVVTYSGDSNNAGATTSCGQETHTITVGEPPPQP